MTVERIYKDLYNYLRWDQYNSVQNLLDNKQNTIDLTYKNGLYFRLAIKNKNLKILNLLLDYYEKTVLKGKEFKDYTTEDSILRKKLQKILEDAVESFDISKEIEKVLSDYVSSSSDEDSDDSQNLGSEYNDSDSDFSDNENNNYNEEPTLTEDNLFKHNIEPIGDAIDVH